MLPQKSTYTYDDFLAMTLSSLKDFLSLRGLNQGGKKAEIVARAFGAYELGVPVKFTQEEINKALNKEYKCQLKKHSTSTDPKLIPEELWMDDVTKWPELDDGKLFGYILQVKAVEMEYISVYKDQKAYSHWMSSFVGPVWYSVCPSGKNTVFLKSEVCPSQKIHDDTHKVWVCFTRDKKGFSICTSWCTCIAEAGEACNHVIAVLYKVNYAFKKNFTSPACTSIPQNWNKGTRKEVQPTRVCNKKGKLQSS